AQRGEGQPRDAQRIRRHFRSGGLGRDQRQERRQCFVELALVVERPAVLVDGEAVVRRGVAALDDGAVLDLGSRVLPGQIEQLAGAEVRVARQRRVREVTRQRREL